MTTITDPTRKARALGTALVSLWIAADHFGDFTDHADDAMQMLTEQLNAIDMHQVEGQLASPLKYWVLARLEQHNPEDLTYDEMLKSIEISLSL